MRFSAIASALLLGAALCAQGGARGTITTIEGRPITGLVTVAADGSVTVAGEGAPISLTLDEVSTFAAEGVVAKKATAPHRIWLRSGLELAATSIRGMTAGEGKPARLSADLLLGVAVDLPISSLRALRLGGAERTIPAGFAEDLRDPADNTDALWVQKDGQQHRFQVTVNGMQAGAIAFGLRGNQHEFPLDGLVAVVFGNNTGFAPDHQRPPTIAVDFDTGERLEGRLLELGSTLRLRLDEGCEVVVPARRILRFAVESDRVKWLSELAPTVAQTAAFDRVWPWTKDRSVAGPGFEIGGKRWARGIGMVPRTRLTYELKGEYETFQTMIGIDDRGGPQAHAVFRVFVDGEVVFESAPKTRGMSAEEVKVPLNGCTTLAIEVDFGKNYDLGDYCAFADARVMR